MKFKQLFIHVSRSLLFTILGVCLFVLALVGIVYSPWAQDYARGQLLTALNRSGDLKIKVDSFRLRFPLSLEIGGLVVTQRGDTLVAADYAVAEARVLPLIGGEVDLKRLVLNGAKYNMGAPDSLMYMRIAARHVDAAPAKVKLVDMDIFLVEGTLDGARVDLLLNPDTTLVDSVKKSEPTNMKIRLGKLHLNDFAYTMRMLPTIDSLRASIPSGQITNGIIDLREQKINIKQFTSNGLDATYLMPDEATLAALPPIPEKPDSGSQPWTIEIENIAVDGGSALYTTRGYTPTPGFDAAYIQVDSLNLNVDNFYNRASSLRLPLSVSGTERCGIALNAAGTVDIDSIALNLMDFVINMPQSHIQASAMLGMGNLASDPNLPVMLNGKGYVGVADMMALLPMLTPYLKAMPAQSHIDMDVDAAGSMSALNIATLNLALPGAVQIGASGQVTNLTDSRKIGGRLSLNGRVSNPSVLNKLFLANSPSLGIPALTLKGDVAFNNGQADADLVAATMGGRIAMDARANINSEGYDISVDANGMPLKPFLPTLDVGLFSGHLKASGHGFNVLRNTSALQARLDVDRIDYGGYSYHDITLTADLSDGEAVVQAHSSDPALKLDLDAKALLGDDCYTCEASFNGDRIDLHAMNFSENPAVVETDMQGKVKYCPKENILSGILTLNSLDFTEDVGRFTVTDVRARINANDSVTNFSIRNRDLYAYLSASCSLDSMITRFADAATVVTHQIDSRTIDVDQLQQALPRFVLDVNAGSKNMLTDMLAENRGGFKSLVMEAANDSSLLLNGHIYGFFTGDTRLDTISIDVNQIGRDLNLLAHVGNRPGTFDSWAKVDITGKLGHNNLDLLLSQHDIKGRQGFKIGGNVQMADSTLRVHFDPLDPVIGYKNWTINPDNFLYLNIPAKHFDANLRMSGAGSSLALFTEHDGGDDHSGDHDHEQEDVVLQLNDIHLADWVTINPFAPPVQGDLSADMRVNYNGTDVNGRGQVKLSDFIYGKENVGSFVSNIDVSTNTHGTIRASADLFVNGTKTMTLAGNLNDSTAMSPFNLDFSMIRFPMSVVNPFLPSGTVKLSGVLNGTMRISGDSAHPVFNGYINFDSTAVNAAITATKYAFSDTRIPVRDNMVTLNDFTISGVNKNPLKVNGTVDISQLTSPQIDLTFKASDMQLVNSDRASRGADIYGKAFVDIDARVRGNMRLLNIDASLGIMPGTDVTYVMSDAQSVIQSQSTGDMVKFVNLNDTAQVQKADSVNVEGILMNIDALLTINNGTAINIDLSADRKNRVELRSQGSVNYTQTPLSDGRLTGRINIEGGQVAYSPPFISEKLFKFDQGSYVAFTGDLLNPQLNVHATDEIKANVTQEGQNSRLVNFDVKLGITGSLDHMDVAFDLATNDDISIANELQSMSAEQRANQAMNLLLYRTYTGPGTKGDANLSGNMLYSFLTSQLNTWAANSIKGVDLSFGIDQYNTTTDGAKGQVMSYSYQVSKSLFNNRVKIVVGGNYATDADADENFSQNLISNISFEYYLNKSQTMMIRLFRRTGYESILEGEVTQTGVGFVYKRKLGSLLDLFRRSRKKPVQTLPVEAGIDGN